MAYDNILTNVDYCHVTVLTNIRSIPISAQRWCYGLEKQLSACL
jgi:hypothetical protein